MQKLPAPALVWRSLFEDHATRIAVTCACLFFYLLGLQVPVPVLAVDPAASSPGNLFYQSSAFTIGLSPWLLSICLWELVRRTTIFDRSVRLSPSGCVSAYGLHVVVTTLIIAAYYAYSYSYFANHPNGNSLIASVTAVSLLAGVATIMLISLTIDKNGTGQGLLTLVCIGYLLGLPQDIDRMAQGLHMYHPTPLEWMGWASALVVALAIALWLVRVYSLNNKHSLEKPFLAILISSLVPKWAFLNSATEHFLSEQNLQSLSQFLWRWDRVIEFFAFVAAAFLLLRENRLLLISAIACQLLFSLAAAFMDSRPWNEIQLDFLEVIAFAIIANQITVAFQNRRLQIATNRVFARGEKL